MSQCPAGLLANSAGFPIALTRFSAPLCVIAFPAPSRPSSIAPVRRSVMGSRFQLCCSTLMGPLIVPGVLPGQLRS